MRLKSHHKERGAVKQEVLARISVPDRRSARQQFPHRVVDEGIIGRADTRHAGQVPLHRVDDLQFGVWHLRYLQNTSSPGTDLVINAFRIVTPHVSLTLHRVTHAAGDDYPKSMTNPRSSVI